MREYGVLPGRYPAIVDSYDAAKRTCRVSIPGVTDGGDVLPEAEIEYPIGDKSLSGPHATEIEIVRGDTVWISFIGGDPRYPVITGWRNPQAGNGVDWRRWHHANIEIMADVLMRLVSGGDMLAKSETAVTVDAPETTITGNLTVLGSVTISGDGVTHGGVNIGKTHKHGDVAAGAAVSGVAQ